MTTRNGCLLFAVWTIVLAVSGCGPNETVLKSGHETPTAVRPSADPFQEDLSGVVTGGYTSIYVLRRRDGARFDKEDRDVIRANTVDAGRRVATSNDTAFIIGAKAPLAEANISALSARFLVEDRSVPVTVEASPSNVSTADK